LHEKLDREIEKPYYKGKVVVVRNKEREGLIRFETFFLPKKFLKYFLKINNDLL
jgi:hypothetical protein